MLYEDLPKTALSFPDLIQHTFFVIRNIKTFFFIFQFLCQDQGSLSVQPRGGLLRMSVQPQSVKPRGVSRMLRWSIVAILFIVVIHFSSLYNSQEEVVENTTLNVPGKK